MAVVSFFLPFLCGSLIRETVKEPTRTVAEVLVAKKKRQKLECNHILPIVFRLLGYSLSTKKKLKVSAFEDFSLSVPCTAAVDTLYHIYYYLSHFVQQQNEKCSAGKWRYQCRVSL